MLNLVMNIMSVKESILTNLVMIDECCIEWMQNMAQLSNTVERCFGVYDFGLSVLDLTLVNKMGLPSKWDISLFFIEGINRKHKYKK